MPQDPPELSNEEQQEAAFELAKKIEHFMVGCHATSHVSILALSIVLGSICVNFKNSLTSQQKQRVFEFVGGHVGMGGAISQSVTILINAIDQEIRSCDTERN